MIHQNVELHNIAEVKELWNGSFQLQRVPESVRQCLNDGAQARCLAAANSEIRFVSDSPKVRVTMSASNDSTFRVAHGTFLNPMAFPLSCGNLTIEIALSENLRELKPEYREGLLFDPKVFRILLPRNTVNLFSIEGDNVRPPAPEQVPSTRYLAYGTSITEGGCSSSSHLSYVSQTARLLGVDLINLGMSGSCQAENEMADYIASRDDWDFATLALSVNMMGAEVEVFRERVNYMVNKVAGANTSRPVACITLYPYFSGCCANHVADEEKAGTFRQILRDAVSDCPHSNVHLIEGPEILDQVDGLTSDMIHPSDFGMMRMAENLAARLKELIGK